VTQATETKAPQAKAPEAKPTERPVIDVTGKRDIILKVIEDIRPNLQKDGGDCELVDIEENRIMVKLKGACIGCQLSSLTLQGVQAKIMAAVGVPVRIIPVTILH
jgi:NifU-like protein